MPIYQFNVFLDSGLQKEFIPLAPVNLLPAGSGMKPSLQASVDVMQGIAARVGEARGRQETEAEIYKLFNDYISRKENTHWKETGYSYVKYRLGCRTWHLENGSEITLNGIWVFVETNTSAQNANAGEKKYDRGYYYTSTELSADERATIIAAYQKDPSGSSYPRGELPYIDRGQAQTVTIQLDFGTAFSLDIILGIRQPIGQTMDVDLVLDLGNTRTAALLFNHQAARGGAGPQGPHAFGPDEFKQKFKILRLKPDITSGEYEEVRDIDAGIVPSWIVLHEQDHQTYRTDGDTEPELQQTEFRNLGVKVIKRLFRANQFIANGEVVKRIPQMFMQLSPVVIGDRATRVFNLPYAKALIAEGANLQQSSPKRYYWDDTPQVVWWSMLLNAWDPSYDEHPANAVALPLLQGEMLRFIREDGKPLDLSKEIPPELQPHPNPTRPAYPKQSTLTWFLLHVLERAYAQSNKVFAAGAGFIPHRLRKVLITYPSGWTNDEVKRYRERCQEALDIFSQTNVYKGVKSPLALELVSRDQTPDEAIAGQIPFVFSEINRLPSKSAAQWFELVGRVRSGQNTVRILNFDIGGGTTDISVVEYSILNTGNVVADLNDIHTQLLFKDGRTLAGDDIVKRVIEDIIFKSLMGGAEEIARAIQAKFTSGFTNIKAGAIRSRIIRTCLIPLATYCIAHRSDEQFMFRAADAGINQNNWDEFLEFLGLPKDALPLTARRFSFVPGVLNGIIRDLFEPLFRICSIYSGAFDVDLIIFSGKPSELPYVKTLAREFFPIDDERIIFARDFKPGQWYPFTDEHGCIQDAKTVTVVGAALYYALSNGFITGWHVHSGEATPRRNEWGLRSMRMQQPTKGVFMTRDTDESLGVRLATDDIIYRRLNLCCTPEPVYRLVCKSTHGLTDRTNDFVLRRDINEEGETLTIVSVNGNSSLAKNFELKLWPSSSDQSGFWQEMGIFNVSLDEDPANGRTGTIAQ